MPSNRWAVLAGVWSAYCAFGVLVASSGALVPSIRADLDITDAQMGMVLGAWQFIFIGTSIPAGRIVDRLGVRRAVMASIVLMLLSGLARSAAGSFWSLFAAVALFGVGAPITSIAAPKVAAALFNEKDRRRAVGTYATAPVVGAGLGLVLPANVIGPLVDDSWRTITLVLSGSAVVALLIWGLVSHSLDHQIRPGDGLNLRDYRALAAQPIVRFVLLLAVLNFVVVHGIGQWLVGILVASGWSQGQAGYWAAFGMIGSLVGTFVLPRAATPERRLFLMIAVLFGGALAAVCLVSTNPVVLAPALLTGGGARSVLMPILLMILMDHRSVGPSRIAAATGLYLAVAQVGGVAGPILTGFLSDSSGGFGLPLAVHVGVMILTAAILVLGYRWAVDSTPGVEHETAAVATEIQQ